jgi:hypothetical protein
MIDDPKFLTKQAFSEIIEKKVLEEDLTYFQAVLEFSEDINRDPDELMQFMSKGILDKIKKSANDLGLIDTGEQSLEDLM